MATIADLFVIHRARSAQYGEHAPGSVAFVSNSAEDNGVVGYVTPLPEDAVFTKPCIVVSALRAPTIPPLPFIARGSAGSGLLVLEPKTEMSMGELVSAAVRIGHEMAWRFNWYRQLTVDRLRRVPVAEGPSASDFSVESMLPPKGSFQRPTWKVRLATYNLETLFDLKAGDYHSLSELAPGRTPVISCGDGQNGIAGYYEVEPKYRWQLTIALNGATLATKYHAYAFAAKDDVAVCTPKTPLRLTTLLFIQVVINMERWRYSYYRKCYMNKLPRFALRLPSRDGAIDEGTIEAVVKGTSYWRYLNTRLAPATPGPWNILPESS